ncbi:MAG: U32 family peptidase [Treponema sp.]|nr:U32 family peptidase [Treponema sp.]
MELLSPAGNAEKLYYAYAYGADAAYIGLKNFSLRVKADNFYDDEYKKVCQLKNQFPGKKLFCALNISFHNSDIESFKNNIEYFRQYPIDAFIVQDLGIVPILQKEFPNASLHLSTQASCVNIEAAKMYRSIGFKRIVLGREASLSEIRQIKDAVPDIELEAFCHGAMCISYAGRCLMSAYLTGRSAQGGECSHTCRWNFSVLQNAQSKNDSDGFTENAPNESATNAKRIAESGSLMLQEEKRPDESFPIYEGENFTAVLSSKDINMIHNLKDMKDAGIDSLKIEGRMKSIYYVALVTRAYRKALDALDGKITNENALPFIKELDNVAHRESTTGFYYNKEDANKTTTGASDSPYLLAAKIGKCLNEKSETEIFRMAEKNKANFEQEILALHEKARIAREKDLQNHPEKIPVPITKKENWYMYEFSPLNKIDEGQTLEIISPDNALQVMEKDSWFIVDLETGFKRNWTFVAHPSLLYTSYNLQEGALVRIKDQNFTTERIHQKGR